MKLSDYYRQTVEKNDKKEGGWSVLYYGLFSKIIEENNYKIVAEVGIGYGTHAKFILKNNKNIEKLYLIDPVCSYENDGFTNDIESKESVDSWNELYELINNELSPWKDKYTFYRNKSLDTTEEQIPDNSLDAIFIDGAHDYDNVLADLNFWFKKVKKGGQILGDDYLMTDVSRAVKDFAKQNKLEYDLLKLKNVNYPIFRFHKN